MNKNNYKLSKLSIAIASCLFATSTMAAGVSYTESTGTYILSNGSDTNFSKDVSTPATLTANTADAIVIDHSGNDYGNTGVALGYIGTSTSASVKINITEAVDITTGGPTANAYSNERGVYARIQGSTSPVTNPAGSVEINMEAGSVTTYASEGTGLFAKMDGETGSSKITFDGSNIYTYGDNAEAAFAYISNADNTNANLSIEQKGGVIYTEGEDSDGLVAFSTQTTGNPLTASSIVSSVTAKQTAGSITTLGDYSDGLTAQVGEGDMTSAATIIANYSNNGVIELTQAGTISTSGDTAYGISSLSGYSGTISISQTGKITTTGAASDGIIAGAGGDIDIEQTASDAEISATGTNANGINAYSLLGDIDKILVAGAVTATEDGIVTVTQSYNGLTIRSDRGTSTITIDDSANITAGTNAVYNDDGNSEITVGSATISGDFVLDETTGSDVGTSAYPNSDKLTFTNTDLSNVSLLDGGDNADYDNSVDILTLNSTDLTGSSSNSTSGEVSIDNWEIIDIKSGSTLTMTGNIEVASDSTDIVGIINNGTIDISTASVAGNNYTLTGDLSGSGKLIINVDLGDDSQETADILTVEGSTKNATITIVPNSIDLDEGKGTTIKVVDVSSTGDTETGDFVLSSSNINGVDYTLTLKSDNCWYLTAVGAPKSTGTGTNVPSSSWWVLIMMMGLMVYLVRRKKVCVLVD